MHQTCAGYCRDTSLLWTCRWPNHSSCHQRYSLLTSSRHGNRTVANACHQLLDYAATHPNAGIRYLASDMILVVHTNTMLTVKHQRTSTSPTKATKNSTTVQFWNLTASSNMSCPWHLSQNRQLSITAARLQYPSKLHLMKWGTNNIWRPSWLTTLRHKVLPLAPWPPKASKSMDQWFHWLKCCSAQWQFLYLWCCGVLNRASYTSKYHAPKHHQAVCPFYIFDSLATQ